MFPTTFILYFVGRSAYFETNVPVTTTINSIGTGKTVFFANFGFIISLLTTQTVIVIADIITAAKFA